MPVCMSRAPQAWGGGGGSGWKVLGHDENSPAPGALEGAELPVSAPPPPSRQPERPISAANNSPPKIVASCQAPRMIRREGTSKAAPEAVR